MDQAQRLSVATNILNHATVTVENLQLKLAEALLAQAEAQKQVDDAAAQLTKKAA